MMHDPAPVDPTTRLQGVWAVEFAERVRGLEGVDVDHANPSQEAIAAMEALGAPMGTGEDAPLTIRGFRVDGPHGPVPVRSYTPAEPSGGALVWMHGGGFIAGDLEMPEADEASRAIAARSGMIVLSVDYRLCVDGVHHPVPVDDCWAVFEWISAHAGELGIDPARIAVGGASAGGALAASVALRAKEQSQTLALAVLVYPVLHPELPKPSDELAACLAVTPRALRFPPEVTRMLNENYLGGPESTATPMAYVGLADDLAGYAPTYIEACEFDELRSSAEAFSRQLADADVPVEYVVAAGVPHGHYSTIGSPYAAASFDRIAQRLISMGHA